jgi:hypothetical protein
MVNLTSDFVNLTRICEFAKRLHQLRQLGGEDAIDRKFAPCAGRSEALPSKTSPTTTCRQRTMPGLTTRECAIEFAADVHAGCVADWWGGVRG